MLLKSSLIGRFFSRRGDAKGGLEKIVRRKMRVGESERVTVGVGKKY